MPPCDLLLLDFPHSFLHKPLVLCMASRDSKYHATELSNHHQVTPIILNPSRASATLHTRFAIMWVETRSSLRKTGLCRKKALANSLVLKHNCVKHNSPFASIPKGMQLNEVNQFLILHHTPWSSYSTLEFVFPKLLDTLLGND